MIFRQLFDRTSCTYTYLVANGGEACLIDPVLEQAERYIKLLRELDLSLVMAIDTHLHADHITGLGTLQARTRCLTVMGEQTAAEIVTLRVADGDCVHVGDLELAGHPYARPYRRFLLLPPGKRRLHRRHAADPRHRPHRFPERRRRRAI